MKITKPTNWYDGNMVLHVFFESFVAFVVYT
jgi:hypothetical protein